MKIGVVNEETWSFFHEVYAELAEHHQTSLYKPKTYSFPFLNGRISRYLSHRDLMNFLRSNQVVFFEWASELLARVSHLPKVCGIVTRLHRYEMYWWADKVNWDAVDQVILVSKAKEREFAARFPDQARKVVVIPEAISVENFKFVHKPFTGDIGTLCHISPRKRVYELVLAFYDLVNQGVDLRLHIGGGKRHSFQDYYEALHGLVKALDLQERVIFYDNVKNAKDWYKNIDIFISNSYSEGLQVSPMEAMATGCYCLSHHWDGADELLPEENLFYTNQQLNAKIIAYAQLPEPERQRLRENMRAIVCDNFDIQRIQAQIREVIVGVGSMKEWA